MPKVTAIVSKKTNRISLVQGHDYEVIGIDDTCFRIVDEAAEPALYPKSFFLDEEPTIPVTWKYRDLGDGEYSITPQEFSSDGFFEDYADRQVAATQDYELYLRKLDKAEPTKE